MKRVIIAIVAIMLLLWGCATLFENLQNVAEGGLKGEHYGRFDLVETHTNHNHEELVESIEVYRCVAERKIDNI